MIIWSLFPSNLANGRGSRLSLFFLTDNVQRPTANQQRLTANCLEGHKLQLRVPLIRIGPVPKAGTPRYPYPKNRSTINKSVVVLTLPRIYRAEIPRDSFLDFRIDSPEKLRLWHRNSKSGVSGHCSAAGQRARPIKEVESKVALKRFT